MILRANKNFEIVIAIPAEKWQVSITHSNREPGREAEWSRFTFHKKVNEILMNPIDLHSKYPIWIDNDYVALNMALWEIKIEWLNN